MNDKYQVSIMEVIAKTLFLAKSLDDFTSFLNPGDDYNIISSHASKEAISKYNNVFIHEKTISRKRYSTSEFFNSDLFDFPELVNQLKNAEFIWIYQAYPWTNDLKFYGKTVFSIDYYLYLMLSNKFSQIKFLKNSKNLYLAKHFELRKKLMCTYYDLGNSIPCFQESVFCSSYSNGGDGVKVIKGGAPIHLRGVRRIEKFIPHSHSLNQIGIAFEDDTLCYSPSIQILSKNLEFLGSTFDCSDIPIDSIKKITNLTKSIGRELSRIGYRGMFGCDYLITNTNEVVFIELNPRYQASTFVLSQNTNSFNICISPHYLHIASFLMSSKHCLKGVDADLDGFECCTKKNSYLKIKNLSKELNIPHEAKVFNTEDSHTIEEGAPISIILSSKPIILKLANQLSPQES